MDGFGELVVDGGLVGELMGWWWEKMMKLIKNGEKSGDEMVDIV